MGASPGETRLGFITGMTSEARLLRQLSETHLVVASGATPAGATAAVRRLLADGVGGVVSFGLAAGLAPSLRPGDLVVPRQVLSDGERFETDPALVARLGGARGASDGCLLHSKHVVAGGDQKQRLHLESGCVALDMESGIAARAAVQAGVGFAVLRAICDPAARDLPPAAVDAIRPDGRLDAGRLALSLLCNPSQLVTLLRLARDAAAARRALSSRTSSIH